MLRAAPLGQWARLQWPGAASRGRSRAIRASWTGAAVAETGRGSGGSVGEMVVEKVERGPLEAADAHERPLVLAGRQWNGERRRPLFQAARRQPPPWTTVSASSQPARAQGPFVQRHVVGDAYPQDAIYNGRQQGTGRRGPAQCPRQARAPGRGALNTDGSPREPVHGLANGVHAAWPRPSSLRRLHQQPVTTMTMPLLPRPKPSSQQWPPATPTIALSEGTAAPLLHSRLSSPLHRQPRCPALHQRPASIPPSIQSCANSTAAHPRCHGTY